MLENFKRQFDKKQFSLTEDDPEIFILSQWQPSKKPNIFYLVYRWLIALYFFVTWVLSILDVPDPDDYYQVKWLIYLTDWGYTLCTMQACIVAFMLSVCVIAYHTKSFESLRETVLFVFYKIYWITNTVATVSALVISVIYWGFIYGGSGNDAVNMFLHAFNSVVMIFDFWIVSHPFKLAHFIYPLIFAGTYATFSVIYYLCGGTGRDGTRCIYPILDWGNPWKSMLVCVGVAVFVLLVHLFYFAMYYTKRKLYEKVDKIRGSAAHERNDSNGHNNEGMDVNEQA